MKTILLTISIASFQLAAGQLDFGGVSGNELPLAFMGIPVPGQTVPPKRILELYTSSCKPDHQESELITKAVQLLEDPRSEEVAKQLYRGLFSSLSDVQLSGLLGKWYKVIYSPNANKDLCSVTYVDTLYDQGYLGAAITKEYFRQNSPAGSMGTASGTITKHGPDPGELLFKTGQENEPCPYFIVNVGPPDMAQNISYPYVVLSQLLKHPVMVLARDPREFKLKYQTEVWSYLENAHFLNPVTKKYNMIREMNFTECQQNDYYFHLQK